MNDHDHHAITCLRTLREDDYRHVVALIQKHANSFYGSAKDEQRRRDLSELAAALREIRLIPR